MDHEFMKDKVVTFEKQEYVYEWSCNIKLQGRTKYTLYLTHRISNAGLLLAPPEDYYPQYII